MLSPGLKKAGKSKGEQEVVEYSKNTKSSNTQLVGLENFLLTPVMYNSSSPISNHFLLNISCVSEDPDHQGDVDSHGLLREIGDNHLVDVVNIMANVDNGLSSKSMDLIFNKKVFINRYISEHFDDTVPDEYISSFMPKHDISPTQYFLGDQKFLLISGETITRLEASITVECQINGGNEGAEGRAQEAERSQRMLSEIPEMTYEDDELGSMLQLNHGEARGAFDSSSLLNSNLLGQLDDEANMDYIDSTFEIN